MWNTIVIAQGAPEGSFLIQILPFILIFGVFWFLVIRPQQKQQQKHQSTLNSLKKDDKIITNGGVFGTIEKVDGQLIVLRVARDTKIKVLLSQVKGLQSQLLGSEEDKEDDKQDDKKSAELEDTSVSDKKKLKSKSDDSEVSDEADSDTSEKW